MTKNEVTIGESYSVKVSGTVTAVEIISNHSRGGYWGVNLATGRMVRVKTAGRLRQHLGKRIGENPLGKPVFQK